MVHTCHVSGCWRKGVNIKGEKHFCGDHYEGRRDRDVDEDMRECKWMGEFCKTMQDVYAGQWDDDEMDEEDEL